MKKYIPLFLITSFVVSWFIVSGSFVVEKKKKGGASPAQLREECCQDFGALLQELPQLLRHIATVQELSLRHSEAIITGDKNNFFNRTDKNGLEKCHAKLESGAEKVRRATALMQELVQVLHDLPCPSACPPKS